VGVERVVMILVNCGYETANRANKSRPSLRLRGGICSVRENI
jgi:hypothetical protein